MRGPEPLNDEELAAYRKMAEITAGMSGESDRTFRLLPTIEAREREIAEQVKNNYDLQALYETLMTKLMRLNSAEALIVRLVEILKREHYNVQARYPDSRDICNCGRLLSDCDSRALLSSPEVLAVTEKRK